MSDTVFGWLFGGWSFGERGRDHGGARSRDVPVTAVCGTDAPDRVAVGAAATNLGQEREWIAGLRAGDVEVFHAVFDTYAPALRRFARIWTPHETAEDIVQDLFLDLWRRRDAFDVQPGHLVAYLFSAVRKRTLKYLRHHRTVRHLESDDTHPHPVGMGMGADTPDRAAMAQELHTAIEAALARLPDMQRAVLVLRWSQGMPYEQISAALSISTNAAMQQASRARQALRAFLSGFIDESV